MPSFTLADAARIAGVSRPTIYRLVKEGKVSVTQDERGVKRVDAAELKRVFPNARFETGETGESVHARKPETPHAELLEVELRGAKELLEVTRQALQSEREEKARLLGVVESQTRMLEDRRTRPETPPAQTGAGAVGWIVAAIFAAVLVVVVFLVNR